MAEDDGFSLLVEQIARFCEAGGWRIGTAESCTGGWVAKVLTDRAGSSVWFERAYVSYSNAAKSDMLGVPAPVLEKHGAVSREVVLAMAAGARERADVDFALAISGVAGPGGGTVDKPVGTVWFAWDDCMGAHADCRVFPGDRDAVRRASVEHALHGLVARLMLAGDRESVE